MTDVLWELQGTTPTEIEATDILQFAGLGGFNEPIVVNSYNDTTHVKSNAGADNSAGNDPRNNKFISQSGGSGGDSQVQVDGGATVNLDTLVDADAALHINLSDVSSFEVADAIFFVYSGSPATPPVGIDVRVAEITDTNFTQAEGSGSPLLLADQGTPATDHDYYIVISYSPLTAGMKNQTMRLEATLS